MSKSISRYFKNLRAMDSHLQKLGEYYHRPKWWFYLDAIACRATLGTPAYYYFSHQIYRLNWMERNQFANDVRLEKIDKLFNTNPQKRTIINNKCGFNTLFAKYIKRDWLYAPEHSAEDIKLFLQKHEAIFLKPPDTNRGVGIEKVACASALQDLAGFVKHVHDDKLLLEDAITQHPQMAEINPSSVNTIRVVSVRDKAGDIHIVAASIRAGGKDQVVDNFHANGVQYPVDPATGIVISGGVMANGTRNVFFHPSTNKKMIGFQVPNWETMLATVKEAAKIPTDIRILGWDMAITEDGCDIVEANINQGGNGMQLDGVGKYKIIMEYL